MAEQKRETKAGAAEREEVTAVETAAALAEEQTAAAAVLRAVAPAVAQREEPVTRPARARAVPETGITAELATEARPKAARVRVTVARVAPGRVKRVRALVE